MHVCPNCEGWELPAAVVLRDKAQPFHDVPWQVPCAAAARSVGMPAGAGLGAARPFEPPQARRASSGRTGRPHGRRAGAARAAGGAAHCAQPAQLLQGAHRQQEGRSHVARVADGDLPFGESPTGVIFMITPTAQGRSAHKYMLPPLDHNRVTLAVE